MKYLDPKADLTFKKIFGNPPVRLKNLLNTLQALNEDELIQQISADNRRTGDFRLYRCRAPCL